MDILSDLNEPQKRAVAANNGPLLIVAGPGTGKTLTIARRIAYLVRQGVRPANILALTFTNRAAREMKERAEGLLGSIANNIFIGTFHLLGLCIIREARGNTFALYTRDEQIEFLKSVLELSTQKARQTMEKISRVKNVLEKADSTMKEPYGTYQAALKNLGGYDFDDLVCVPVEMFENSEELRKTYQARYQYIIVDEYQDINPAQFRFLTLLAGNSENICVVGDADQAIYAFRGADLRNFLAFERDYPGATRIVLSSNYRSTRLILEAAAGVIQHNKNRIDKDLQAIRDEGSPVTIVSVPDERAEGRMIVAEIEKRIGGTSRYQMMRGNTSMDDPGRSFRFSDFAVIFRTHAQAKILEEQFSASGIPYQVIGKKSSLQMQEAETTEAYLLSLIHPEAASGQNAADAQAARLLGPEDYFDSRADAVTLMTLHMAKGLEFSVVFIAGCEEGLIPYTLHKEDSEIEEERRLFYVGMTRAKDELFLISSRKRHLYGQRLSSNHSPFIEEIPETHIRRLVVPDREMKEKESDHQLGLF